MHTTCKMHYVAATLPLLRRLQNAFLEESRCGNQLELSRLLFNHHHEDSHPFIDIDPGRPFHFSRRIEIFSCAGTGLVGGLWPGSIGWPSNARGSCHWTVHDPAPDPHLNLKIFKKTKNPSIFATSVCDSKQTSTGDERRLSNTQS